MGAARGHRASAASFCALEWRADFYAAMRHLEASGVTRILNMARHIGCIRKTRTTLAGKRIIMIICDYSYRDAEVRRLAGTCLGRIAVRNGAPRQRSTARRRGRMAPLTPGSLLMKGKTVAVLESRMRDQVADLIRKLGGTPFVAPALAEIPDVDATHIEQLIDGWQSAPPDIFIFQTGVGTRALFTATDRLGLTETLLRFLEMAQVVVRGPKPTAALRSRKVRIDISADDPFTTHEVLAKLADRLSPGKRVAVQRYGETNRELQLALAAKGTEIIEITTYRWGLPDDLAPLQRLIDALEQDAINLVAFTSASQVVHLFAVAEQGGKEASLRRSLGRTLVASIGPVCSSALRQRAVRVDIEARPPKLGPFIDAINAALTDSGPSARS